MNPIADENWYATLGNWLHSQEELLLEFASAGSGGAESYELCSTIGDIRGIVERVPIATRIYVYSKQSLDLRGVVDSKFAKEAKKRLPNSGDFLVYSFEKPQFSLGYDGYLGDTEGELEEILDQCRGEYVAFGPSPACDNSCERIVVYKGGERGAY